jgi:hypothetical protein
MSLLLYRNVINCYKCLYQLQILIGQNFVRITLAHNGYLLKSGSSTETSVYLPLMLQYSEGSAMNTENWENLVWSLMCFITFKSNCFVNMTLNFSSFTSLLTDYPNPCSILFTLKLEMITHFFKPHDCFLMYSAQTVIVHSVIQFIN